MLISKIFLSTIYKYFKILCFHVYAFYLSTKNKNKKLNLP